MTGFSLRDFAGPAEPPRRPPLDSAIDRIMRQAAAPHQVKDGPVTATGNLSDIHGPRDIASRIKSLQAEGVEQITDKTAIRAMKPDQIVAAQREGKLLTYMTGITAPASEG